MSLPWMAIRGSGLVAYLLLSGATIWGLLVSTKVLGAMKAKQVTWFHESLSIGALLATGVHMYALTQDEFIEFTVRDLFVPGAATWNPTAVAFGVMAFYALLLIIASFYLKKVIGQAAWRGLHYTAFGAFVSALLHGVQAGTDSDNPWFFSLYIATGAIAATLLVIRIVQAFTPDKAPRARPRPAKTPVSEANTRATEATPEQPPSETQSAAEPRPEPHQAAR